MFPSYRTSGQPGEGREDKLGSLLISQRVQHSNATSRRESDILQFRRCAADRFLNLLLELVDNLLDLLEGAEDVGLDLDFVKLLW